MIDPIEWARAFFQGSRRVAIQALAATPERLDTLKSAWHLQRTRIADLEAENKLLRQQREAHLETMSRTESCFMCGERVLKAGAK